MGRSLPGNWMPPTTESVAFFKIDINEFARWLVGELEHGATKWSVQKISGSNVQKNLTLMLPLVDIGVTRYLLLSDKGWTAMLNNGRSGTDVGMIPSIATRKLDCLAVRAVAIDDQADRYGATILEVYDPAVDNLLRCRRTISAANDGGKWRFDQSGDPFLFEDTGALCNRRIRDRFTPLMLHNYLDQLDVPPFANNHGFEGAPVLIEKIK